MPTGIRRLKGLPLFPTAAKSFTTRGRAFSLLSCLPCSRQRGLSQRRRQGLEARVLRQPGASRCRGKVPTHGETRLRFDYSSPQTQTILSSLHSDCPTDKPLRRAMSNPEAASRLVLWAIELSKFDIQYCPRIAIKGQVVVDFIAEFTNGEDKGAIEDPQWSTHTDGSSNKQAGGAGIVLLSPKGDKIECMIRLDFPTTNNETEYETLVVGLDLAKAVGATNIVLYCDSQVVTNQVNGDYECKGERMKKYLEQVRRRVDNQKAKIIQIPKGENEQANHLAKAASAEYMIALDNVLSFVQLAPLIDSIDV